MSNLFLDDVKGIGEKTLKKLKNANITSVEQLANINVDELIKIKGIGRQSAKDIMKNAKQLLKNMKSQAITSQGYTQSIEDNKIIKKLQKNIKDIISRLDNIEIRLNKIAKDKSKVKEDLSKLKANKPRLKDQKLFLQILKERVQDLSKRRFGVRKMPIKELYEDLVKIYNINKEDFSEFLLNLYNKEKIQLEPGTIDNDFKIKDNFGNTYKIIRLLD